MKKTIAMLLALCMIFALSACSLDSLITSAENEVVKFFHVNASGDPEANRQTFAANACLMLLDAAKAAELNRAFISSVQGTYDTVSIIDGAIHADDDYPTLVRELFTTADGSGYDVLLSTYTAASVGYENLKLTLPENDSVCSDIMAKLDALMAALEAGSNYASSVYQRERYASALEALDHFDELYKGLYDYISQYRLKLD